VSEQLALLPGYLTAHLQLALLAILLGTALSVPLGVFVTRRPGAAQAVLGVASVIQTIPSLALLAIMVPALAALGAFTAPALGLEIRSIGYLPAVVALTLYSILPILQNTVIGIRGVDAAIVEAARGVGMTGRQMLFRVELPLALPVIVAGLRTASVWVIGTTVLSTPVGATSLGNYIFSGLQTRNFVAVSVGCIAAAVLALLLDQVIRALELGVRQRRRRVVALASAALAALYGYTGLSFALERLDAPERMVAIGSKTFTEQYILSQLIARYLERETGLASRALQSLGSTVLFDALVSGEIDVYVDYSGTIWATILKREGLPGSREQVLREVEEALLRDYGVHVPAAFGFENTYALGMRRQHARELGTETFSDLARIAPSLEIGGDYEFFARAEWAALVDVYGFAFHRKRSMDSALMYEAVASGEVDVISAFSTDGRIAAFDLALLRDDRGVIPPYDAIVLVGPDLARERPDALRALARLAGSIDESAMQRLNYAVDEGGESPTAVARGLLAELPSER
jgi:osmoprotectant transport system permease protein